MPPDAASPSIMNRSSIASEATILSLRQRAREVMPVSARRGIASDRRSLRADDVAGAVAAHVADLDLDAERVVATEREDQELADRERDVGDEREAALAD